MINKIIPESEDKSANITSATLDLKIKTNNIN